MKIHLTFRQQAANKKLANGTLNSYGSTDSPSRFDSSDLDELFPERVRHRSIEVSFVYIFEML